jgi:glycosyltransferase involved in cell wall biosynthesis
VGHGVTNGDSAPPREGLGVIHVSAGYVDLSRDRGGVSNIVRHLCLEGSEAGCRTVLLCGDRELGEPVAGATGRHPVQAVAVEVFPQARHPALGPVAGVRRAIREVGSPAVVHVHAGFSAFTEAAMGAAGRARIPFVFSPHGKLSGGPGGVPLSAKRLWWKWVLEPRLRSAARIVFSGRTEAPWVLRQDRLPPTAVIPNGFTCPDGREVEPWESARPYVLFLGYLDPRKQPGFLIEAFARAAVRTTHQLVLAGPDSYGHRGWLESLARSRGVPEAVRFVGPVADGEKWALLRGARCLCLPSRSEGQPLVLVEALGAGVPSLYSSACNFPEISEGGAGVEVPGFGPDRWAAEIDALCLDDGRRDRMRAAAARLAPGYGWRAIGRRWVGLYEEVAREHHARRQDLRHAR